MRRRDVMLGAAAVAVGGVVGVGEAIRVPHYRCAALRGEMYEAYAVLRDAWLSRGARRGDSFDIALSAIMDVRLGDGGPGTRMYQPKVRAAIMSTLSFQRGRGASYADTMRAMVDLHVKFDLAWAEMYDAMRVMCWQPKWDGTLGRPDESWSEAALRSVT